MKLPILLLSLLPAFTSASFYRSNPNVFELTPSNFDSVVLESNQTSLIEFYAPWCGHCQTLKSDFMKAGKVLKDIANIGAVNCDEERNKPLCSKYRVQGFPTLIAFRPPKYDVNKRRDAKKSPPHATETYQGARNTKGLVDFVTGRMKNYVKRIVTEEKLSSWVKGKSDEQRLKMVVYTKKDRLSPMLKSIAIDHLEHLDICYFPIKEGKTKIDKLAELGLDQLEKAQIWIYVDGDLNQGIRYEGEVDKVAIAQFLKQFEQSKNSVEKVLQNYQKRERLLTGKKTAGSGKAKKDEL
ncbi:hypothetical protein WICPIJ_009352 [Wickerhamomyces pijperi]|uniref:Thioredoxin domain-containing protein n=1 Tax=Wickerhamomyces pijperi TaxID=599730 RepID=A0A9P8PQG6_WICPI|nr:hypothetical protein WICPIJ_009352 [Wickerhamomyces pijperi]